MPLQLPPHALPSETQAGRPPVGAPLVAAHMPIGEHCSHWPVQAALQQMPSGAQKPLPH